jgi:hypothetical protein
MEDLAELVEANEDIAAAIAAAYEILLGGVPNIAGFEFLIENAVATNFGAGPGVEFNQENIFINVANALVQGNPTAAANFSALIAGQATLADQVEAIYNALVPPGAQSAEGLAFLIRPEALAFYAQVAADRGVAGPDGAAIVAMASILNIAVQADLGGIGDATNDLIAAILNGTAQLPASGDTFTPIETADGTGFDEDDNEGGRTITLTDRIDAPGIDENSPGAGRDTTGTGFDDRYLASDATLNPGDVIDAGGGIDELTLNLVDAKILFSDIGGYSPPFGFLGVIVDLPLFEVESDNLENVVIQLEGGNDIVDDIIAALFGPPPPPGVDPEVISGAAIDLSRSTGVTDVTIERTAGLVSVEAIQNNVRIWLDDSVGLFSFNFDTDALGGAADADLVVDANHVFGVLIIEAQGGEAFDTLSLNTTDFNILMVSDNFDSALPLTTLNVTGTGTNLLLSGILDPDLAAALNGEFLANEFAGLTTVNLSATGGTFIELFFNREDLTLNGSSGNDIALFGAFDTGSGNTDGWLTDDDDVDTGGGYDGLIFGGEDLANLTGSGIANVEFYGILSNTGGDPFKFENGDHDVDLGLFTDWGNTLELENMDGHEVYLLFYLGGTELAFDDTDVATINVGLPAEFANYVDLLTSAVDELGLEFILPLLASAPLFAGVDTLDLSNGVETAQFNIGLPSALPFPESQLSFDEIIVGLDLETIAASGPGDLFLNDITVFDADADAVADDLDDLPALTFDFTALTGGVDLGGMGITGGTDDGIFGSQTFLIGDIGNIEAGDLFTSYDFDGDGTDDDSSVIDLGEDAAAAAPAGDAAQDNVVFGAEFSANLAIENFTGWNVAVMPLGQQDVLDFTAAGVNELGDLVFTDVADGVVITSDLFDGQVLLVGVLAADLSNENFDFVA